MITPSVSCAHTWEASLKYPHCGTCSQCVDRRFGIIAAGAESFDPQENYKLDIFTKSRPKDEDKILGAAYLDRAHEFGDMSDWPEILARYPEVADVLPYLDMPKANGAAKILDLHKRHAAEIAKVSRELLARHAGDIFNHRLDDDCLVRTMYESRGLPSPPIVESIADRDVDQRQTRGRLKWLPGFDTVWLDDEPHDLRNWDKARACLQMLVEWRAFSKDSALHLVDEIDPYVREQSGLPPAPHSVVKIQDYFKDGGPLRDLCKEIVKPVAGEGRYFLKVD